MSDKNNGYKTIIAGSRSIDDKELVFDVINDIDFEISTVISGGADGVDSIGEDWAEKKNIQSKDIHMKNIRIKGNQLL